MDDRRRIHGDTDLLGFRRPFRSGGAYLNGAALDDDFSLSGHLHILNPMSVQITVQQKSSSDECKRWNSSLSPGLLPLEN
jgi:hypothetical protein